MRLVLILGTQNEKPRRWAEAFVIRYAVGVTNDCGLTHTPAGIDLCTCF